MKIKTLLANKIRTIIKTEWADIGRYDSCGYNDYFSSYDIEDEDIKDAIINENGILHLPCHCHVEDSDKHRGININILDLI